MPLMTIVTGATHPTVWFIANIINNLNGFCSVVYNIIFMNRQLTCKHPDLPKNTFLTTVIKIVLAE